LKSLSIKTAKKYKITETMEKIINDIENFLHHYQTVYGEKVFLDGELQNPQPSETPPAVKKQAPQPVRPRPQARRSAPKLPEFKGELQKYYEEIRDCVKCPLARSRTNFVFGSGSSDADIMFVGEAPGRDEDEQGIPFVGRAGQLLNKMLQAIGLERDEIFIANILKCRPPNNRDPLAEEVLQCEPHLIKQIELISPKVIVALGRIAGKVLLKRDNDTLKNLRQTVHRYNNLPLIVTYHPAALLRNPNWKKEAWQDLKKIREYISE
jgi:DNA polymerase